MNSPSFKASFVSRHKARRRHIVQDSPPQQLIVFFAADDKRGLPPPTDKTAERNSGRGGPSLLPLLPRSSRLRLFRIWSGGQGTCSSANFAFSFCNEMGGALHPSSGSNKFFDLAASQSMQHIRCTFPSRCTTVKHTQVDAQLKKSRVSLPRKM